MAEREAEGEAEGETTQEPSPPPPLPLPDRAEGLTRLAFGLATRLLSPDNIVDRSTAGQYLLMAARDAGRPAVTVDLRMRLVDPLAVRTPPVALALLRLESAYHHGLRALGVDPNEILAAAIALRFDFASARRARLAGRMFSLHMIEPEAVNYDCRAWIRDREREYRVKVPEWWRG